MTDSDYPYNYSSQMLKNQGSVILFTGFIIGLYTGVML